VCQFDVGPIEQGLIYSSGNAEVYGVVKRGVDPAFQHTGQRGSTVHVIRRACEIAVQPSSVPGVPGVRIYHSHSHDLGVMREDRAGRRK
jgi:hypothetical protein